jgi:hypothetical protein
MGSKEMVESLLANEMVPGGMANQSTEVEEEHVLVPEGAAEKDTTRHGGALDMPETQPADVDMMDQEVVVGSNDQEEVQSRLETDRDSEVDHEADTLVLHAPMEAEQLAQMGRLGDATAEAETQVAAAVVEEAPTAQVHSEGTDDALEERLLEVADGSPHKALESPWVKRPRLSVSAGA